MTLHLFVHVLAIQHVLSHLSHLSQWVASFLEGKIAHGMRARLWHRLEDQEEAVEGDNKQEDFLPRNSS